MNSNRYFILQCHTGMVYYKLSNRRGATNKSRFPEMGHIADGRLKGRSPKFTHFDRMRGLGPG